MEENRSLGNYVFSAKDVGHFLDANLFGAPLGATMIQTHGLEAFTEFNRAAVIAVGVPMMILAGIATYFNSRASVARQSPEAAANPQTAMMNKLALYVFPLGVVVGGPFLPLAIIMYWLANNIWTFGQQHYVFGKIEKEEEAKKLEAHGAPRRQRAGARRQAESEAQGAGPRRRSRRRDTAATTAPRARDRRQDLVDRRRSPTGARRRASRAARNGAARTALRARAPGPRNGNVDARVDRRTSG